MSIVLIAVSGIVSLIIGYFIASPFLSETVEGEGVYPEFFNNSRSDTYKEALENLDYAYQSKTLSEEEFELQKMLLLKDAMKFISDKE